MNIYFSCSITGGRQDQAVYAQIVNYLQGHGHHVLTAHLSQPDVLQEEKIVNAQDVYQRDVEWVQNCDALVAEVSTTSHGVGYEIALALLSGKPVLCCYREGRTVSKMILGNTHLNLRIHAYQGMDDLRMALESFVGRTHAAR